jgi:flagellar export protein FliJ
MKSLPTLLKVAQRRIDALAVEAARALEEIDAIARAGEAARARQGEEVALGSAQLETALMLPAYTARMKAENAERSSRIAGIEQTLARVRAALMEAYREKSKFEQLLEREEVRLAAEALAREQAAMDEAALNGLQRKR